MIITITVTYNSSGFLMPFLESFRSQTVIDRKLIIIDNNSNDTTPALLDGILDPDILVIKNVENVGVAAANNQGIRQALALGAEAILLINNDTEFGRTLFSELYQSLSGSNADAVSPAITYFDQPDRIWYAGGRFLTWRGMISYHDRFKQPLSELPFMPFKTEYAPTTCLMFKPAVFDQLGLLDEQYFCYWEDADFCWRMKLARMSILCDPRQILLHRVSASTGGGESDFSIYHIYRNHMIFLRKYHGAVARIYAVSVLVAKALLRLSLRRTDVRRLGLQIAAVREGLSVSIFSDTSETRRQLRTGPV